MQPSPFSFLSALNPAPLLPAHRLTTRDGHFVDTTGRRVRLVGVSLPSLPASLPASLHQAGVNLVRLPLSAMARPQEWDPLVAALKQHGLYLALDLSIDPSPTAYFDPSTLARQQQQVTALLTRHNPRTGLSLAQDPVLALLTLQGTSSLVDKARQLDRLSPQARKPLVAAWNAYLLKKYKTTALLRQRWGGPDSVPPRQGIEQGTLELAHISGIPAGIDFTHFLMTVEDSYCRTLKRAIRATGCQALLSGAQASAGGIAGVWREAKLDWVELAAPPQDTDSLEFRAMHRVAGKPYVVHTDRAEVAAFAAWQDWDGLFLSPTTSLLPAAVALFLRGDLAPAASQLTLTIPTNKLAPLKGLGTDGAFWGLAETRFAQGELALAPERADTRAFLTHRAAIRFEPDPGPIALGVLERTDPFPSFTWDQAKRQVRLDSPRTKGFLGSLAGSAVRVRGLVAEVAATASPALTLLLTSHDDKPTDQTSSLVLSTPEGTISATIHLATQATHATVWPLEPTGKRGEPLPSTLENGTLTFELTPQHRAHSYVLELTFR